MNIRISINIREDANLEYVEQMIGELPAYLEKYLWSRLLEVAQQIASKAVEYAPRRTGSLQASIHAVVEENGIAVEADIPYAVFVEHGMFIDSAMQEHYDLIRQTIVEVIEEYFRTVQA